jgi:hypothetical protein
MPELKNISVRHDQIMDWLIANPALPLSACAAFFGLTQPWLSSIIHSDLFQAELSRKKEQVFGEVALTVKDRLTALAHDSLKRLHEKVVVEDSTGLLIDASDMALKALGFGAPKVQTAGGSINIGTLNVVNKDILAEARARMEGRPAIEHSPGAAPQIPLNVQQAERILE